MEKYCINCNYCNKKDLYLLMEHRTMDASHFTPRPYPCRKLVEYNETIPTPKSIAIDGIKKQYIRYLNPFIDNVNNECMYYDDRSCWQKIISWFKKEK